MTTSSEDSWINITGSDRLKDMSWSSLEGRSSSFISSEAGEIIKSIPTEVVTSFRLSKLSIPHIPRRPWCSTLSSIASGKGWVAIFLSSSDFHQEVSHLEPRFTTNSNTPPDPRNHRCPYSWGGHLSQWLNPNERLCFSYLPRNEITLLATGHWTLPHGSRKFR